MKNIQFMLLVAMIVISGACSNESLKRTGYETLQNVQQQQCLNHPSSECPERESYEDYERKRKSIEK